MLRPPALFNPADANKLVVYTTPELSGVALLYEADGARLSRVEFFSGRLEDASSIALPAASIVDQVTFMTDRNNYVQILKAQRAEETQLDEENQDLCAGDVVLALPALVLEQARTALNMWVDYHVRPDDWIPLLTNRRKLWRKEAAVYKIEKPARDVGKSFRLLGSHDRRPLRAEWHHVRRKF